jgi:hypothetical protein
MKDTVSHYVPPHSPLTSTEPQVFSNNLTMPSRVAAVGAPSVNRGGGLPRAVRGTPARQRRAAPVHRSRNEVRQPLRNGLCRKPPPPPADKASL